MPNDQLLKGLTEEQIAKARECRSSEELLAKAKKEGIALTEEQLAAVNGGCGASRKSQGPLFTCPNPYCQSHDIEAEYNDYLFASNGGYECVCRNCGAHFEVR